jgi:hypothetical protein
MEDNIRQTLKDSKKDKYCIDRDGNVLFIQPLRTEKLPPYTLPLGLNVFTKASKLVHSVEVLDEDGKPGTKQHRKSRHHIGTREGWQDVHFKPLNTLASSLASGEYITKINNGVSVKIGDDQVRAGLPFQEDPQHISRKLYLERVGNMSFYSTFDSTTDNTSADGQTSEKVNMDKVKEFDNESQSPSKVVRFPDIDVFEGAKKVKKPEESTATQDSMLYTDYSVPPTADSVIFPPVLPEKPNTRQRLNVSLLNGGVDKIHPRDRDNPLSMVPVAQRKKLPAPTIGKTTGHGMLQEFESPTKKSIVSQSLDHASPMTSHWEDSFLQTHKSFDSFSHNSSFTYRQTNIPEKIKIYQNVALNSTGQ